MMTALLELPILLAASARNNCDIDRPPSPRPPTFKKFRREIPSQKGALVFDGMVSMDGNILIEERRSVLICGHLRKSVLKREEPTQMSADIHRWAQVESEVLSHTSSFIGSNCSSTRNLGRPFRSGTVADFKSMPIL